MSYAKNSISLVAMSFAIFFSLLGSPQSKESTDAEIKLGTIFTSDPSPVSGMTDK